MNNQCQTADTAQVNLDFNASVWTQSLEIRLEIQTNYQKSKSNSTKFTKIRSLRGLLCLPGWVCYALKFRPGLQFSLRKIITYPILVGVSPRTGAINVHPTTEGRENIYVR